MTRYATHTLDQSFYDWDRKRVEKRNNFWQMLKLAMNDYVKLTDQASLEYEVSESAFYYYLQQNYGLKIELIDGKIGGEYIVTDDKKHLLFLMKYAG